MTPRLSLGAVLRADAERESEKELYDRSLRIEPRSLVAEVEESAAHQDSSMFDNILFSPLRRVSVAFSEVTVGRLASTTAVSKQTSPQVLASPAHSMELEARSKSDMKREKSSSG